MQGQEAARQGQTTRMSSQLDRIENKVQHLDSLKRLAKLDKLDKLDELSMSRAQDVPPPLPSKDGHDERPASPALSESSSSSLETARPVTPPPVIIPPAITQRLDDMSSLLGTVLGQQRDILDELDRRQQSMEELDSSRQLSLPRIQDLLYRILDRVSDGPSEYAPSEPMSYLPRKRPATYSDIDDRGEGPFYPGTDSVYSDEGGRRAPAPANTTVSGMSVSGRATESLLGGDVGAPEFDEELEMLGLPPDSPPREPFIPRAPLPSFMHQPPPGLIRQEPLLQDYSSENGDDPVQDTRAMNEEPSLPSTEDQASLTNSADVPLRAPRKAPPPRQVDLPTPVNERKELSEAGDAEAVVSDIKNLPPPGAEAQTTRRPAAPERPDTVNAAPPYTGRKTYTRFSRRQKPVSSTL